MEKYFNKISIYLKYISSSLIKALSLPFDARVEPQGKGLDYIR